MNIKESWFTVFGAKAARDNQIESLQKEFLSSNMVPGLVFNSYEPYMRSELYILDGVKYIPEYIKLAKQLYNEMDISPLLL